MLQKTREGSVLSSYQDTLLRIWRCDWSISGNLTNVSWSQIPINFVSFKRTTLQLLAGVLKWRLEWEFQIENGGKSQLFQHVWIADHFSHRALAQHGQLHHHCKYCSTAAMNLLRFVSALVAISACVVSAADPHHPGNIRNWIEIFCHQPCFVSDDDCCQFDWIRSWLNLQMSNKTSQPIEVDDEELWVEFEQIYCIGIVRLTNLSFLVIRELLIRQVKMPLLLILPNQLSSMVKMPML